MSEHIAQFKSWVESLRDDVATLERVAATSSVSEDARAFATAGLNYLVQRMDLVPDWEPAIGVLDDVFVVRLCARLATQHPHGGLDDKTEMGLARLANHAERIEEFLGDELYTRLLAHCSKLDDKVVRGQSPRAIIADPAALARLKAEVAEDVDRLPVANFGDAEQIAVKLKAYLEHKLT
jgi:uncharacterized membrane protein YkvA (DUF1232 family)